MKAKMAESEVIKRLEDTIVSFNEELALEMAGEVIKNDYNPGKAVDEGLVKGLNIPSFNHR